MSAEEVIGFRGLTVSALREVLNGYSKKKPATPSSSSATASTSRNVDKQKSIMVSDKAPGRRRQMEMKRDLQDLGKSVDVLSYIK
jgi:hypothetical protein